MTNSNKYYNLLLARVITSIEEEVSVNEFKLLNLNINTLKRKKRKKLNINEIDNLENIIKKLKDRPQDKRFKENILKLLKAFLIYGNVNELDKNNISLTIYNKDDEERLIIRIYRNSITFSLECNKKKETGTWSYLENDYYTKYEINEDGKKIQSFHGFANDIEVIYKKEIETKEYKETITYYRKNGEILKSYSKIFQNRKKGLKENIFKTELSIDYNDKYIKDIGDYKVVDDEEVKQFTKRKREYKNETTNQ